MNQNSTDAALQTVKKLVQPVAPCSPNDPVEYVLRQFQHDETLLALPIVHKGKVLGIVRREPLLRQFSLPFAHELYGRKQIMEMMEYAPLIIDWNTPVDIASQKCTARTHDQLYTPIVAISQDQYKGVIPVHKLLEFITKQKILQAKDANPLTGLPGNRQIEAEIKKRMNETDGFWLCHVDLDNFKAFNDCYGYGMGDNMIRMLATVLDGHLAKDDFLGHVGGDDFIVIMGLRRTNNEILQSITRAFRENVSELYSREDAARGFIEALDRQGRKRRFPLASASIGVAIHPNGGHDSWLAISEAASEMKCLAKKRGGGVVCIDQRAAAALRAPSPENQIEQTLNALSSI